MCDAKRIPEDILMEAAADVLEIPEFDETVFKESIAEIHVPEANRLIFIFHDGRQEERIWLNPTYAESRALGKGISAPYRKRILRRDEL